MSDMRRFQVPCLLRRAKRRTRARYPKFASGALIALVLQVLLGGCEEANTEVTTNSFGGSPGRGAKLIADIGCGGCHIIPGITGADGLVGPPLNHMSRRVYLAGLLRNTPENMMTWLQNPQQVVPNNAMPDMNLSEDEARDIAAYLYTLE